MQLKQVDIVGAQSHQSLFYRLGQVIARGAHVIRSGSRSERRLGREDEILAPATLDRAPQYLLGRSRGIDIGRIEHIDAGLETDVDYTAGLDRVAATPGLEEFPFAAERAGAEAQNGHIETGRSESAKFHVYCSLIWPIALYAGRSKSKGRASIAPSGYRRSRS